MKRLPLASDEPLIGYSRVLVEVLNSLRKRSQPLCHAYVYGLSPDAGESFDEWVPPWTMFHEEHMTTLIIESSAAAADNAGLKSAQLRALNATLVQQLKPLHGQAFQWLRETDLNEAQRYALCNLHIHMLSTLNALPSEQSASLIRDWFHSLH